MIDPGAIVLKGLTAALKRAALGWLQVSYVPEERVEKAMVWHLAAGADLASVTGHRCINCRIAARVNQPIRHKPELGCTLGQIETALHLVGEKL